MICLLDSPRQLKPEAAPARLTGTELTELRRKYPDIPRHYLAYLERVGWGDVGLMIYSGPVSATEVLAPDLDASVDGILLIGDDFAGWSIGLDTRNGWRLVGVDEDGELDNLEARSLLYEVFNQRRCNAECG